MLFRRSKADQLAFHHALLTKALAAAATTRAAEEKAAIVPPEAPDRAKWPQELHVQGNKVLTKDGKEILIRPKLSPKSLRQDFVRLRGVRYFMRFYPAGERIAKVRLLDSKGNVRYSTKGFEGGFEGPMEGEG